MEKEELFRALDGLFAYDTGATDSGIKNEELRERVKKYLVSLLQPNEIYPEILGEYVRDHCLKSPYGLEDAKAFIEWLGTSMGFE